MTSRNILCCSIVTVLQAPMRSLDFLNWPKPCRRTVTQSQLSISQKWGPGIFLGVKGGWRIRLTTSQPAVSLSSRKCGNPDVLQACRLPCLLQWLLYLLPLLEGCELESGCREQGSIFCEEEVFFNCMCVILHMSDSIKFYSKYKISYIQTFLTYAMATAHTSKYHKISENITMLKHIHLTIIVTICLNYCAYNNYVRRKILLACKKPFYAIYNIWLIFSEQLTLIGSNLFAFVPFSKLRLVCTENITFFY
jgi:hypothetical protein